MTRDQFVQKYKSYAINASVGTNLFPSVFLAQGILESGNGNSSLAADYKNFFGIKADKAWKGKSVNMNTREVVKGKDTIENAGFRVYNSVAKSFEDRVKFLDTARYRKAGVFDAKTAEEQADALQRAGYATDHTYAEKLKGIIKDLNLTQLDKQKTMNRYIDFGVAALLIVVAALIIYKQLR